MVLSAAVKVKLKIDIGFRVEERPKSIGWPEGGLCAKANWPEVEAQEVLIATTGTVERRPYRMLEDARCRLLPGGCRQGIDEKFCLQRRGSDNAFTTQSSTLQMWIIASRSRERDKNTQDKSTSKPIVSTMRNGGGKRRRCRGGKRQGAGRESPLIQMPPNCEPC